MSTTLLSTFLFQNKYFGYNNLYQPLLDVLSIAMVDLTNVSVNPLEQFVLLAKNARGAAAVELIKQALEAPAVFVFGELLDMPNIQVNFHK